MRTRAALVAAATLGGLLVAPSSAVGVAASCGGGQRRLSLQSNTLTPGTEGDDVIVGHDGLNIDARGGNDLICMDSGYVVDGAGDDSIVVTGTDATMPSTAELGAGNDRFVGGPGDDDVSESDPAGSDTISVLGVERLTTGGLHLVVMRGGPGPDSLVGFGCHIRMSGGAGADRLLVNSYPSSEIHSDTPCSGHADGRPGPDHLNGGYADDRLTGGSGRDVAHGRAGADTCRAEREFSCER